MNEELRRVVEQRQYEALKAEERDAAHQEGKVVREAVRTACRQHARKTADRPMSRRDHYICAALAGYLGSIPPVNRTTPGGIAQAVVEYAEAAMHEADRSANDTGDTRLENGYMDAEAVLLSAADLLDREGAWTQAFVARDAEGWEIDPYNNSAVQWSAVGAIAHVTGIAGYWLAGEARCLLVHTIASDGYDVPRSVPDVIKRWNDTRGRTREEVVAALRRAAERAAEEAWLC